MVIDFFFFFIYIQTDAEDAILNKKRSAKAEVKYKKRQRFAKVDPSIDEQFQTSRLLGEYYKLYQLGTNYFNNAMMILNLIQ